MAKGKVFLIGGDQKHLIPMPETAYAREDLLQVLVARYPDLLPGEQIAPDDPPRWLLVGREIGVPGDADESARWSLDHLFLDHNGVPTFVECKRASDTRARREVVAQMLDYAANGIEYWSMAQLMEAATQSAKERGNTIEQEISQLVDPGGEDEVDPQAYWQLVERNLRKGNVRLIFVADEAPKELRRLVEFLNGKMQDVQVLAVEIKQYLSDNHQVVVPRVIGVTEAARELKGSTVVRKGRTNRGTFLGQLEDPKAAQFFAQVLDMAQERGYTIYWGEKGFSVRVFLPTQERYASFVYGWPEGKFDFHFAQLPLTEQQEAELRRQLMGFGVFAKSGERTLKAQVNPGTIERLNRAYDFILREMQTISVQ